jgi:hypothetical protein
VDDIIILSKPQDKAHMLSFKDALIRKYTMREIGDMQWFLGIQIIHDRNTRRLWLCQDLYIDKIVKRYGLETQKLPKIPLSEALSQNKDIATPSQIFEYQQKVGSLLYAAIMTCLDVAFTAAKLLEFVQNPLRQYIEAVN